jgi:hypothetical protein
MKAFPRPALSLLRCHKRAYLLLNVAFYGLVVAGALFAFTDREVQASLTRAILEGFGTQPMSMAKDAYLSGNVLRAALVTFLINSLLGAFLTITAPSLFIPFAGIAIGLYRALMWGIALAPTSPELARAMVPHSLTLILEGQGYVLAMFAAHVLWVRAFGGFRKEGAGFPAGYLAGLRGTLDLYHLVLLLLAIAAIYEAFEVIYIVR